MPGPLDGSPERAGTSPCRPACGGCGSGSLQRILDLGNTPLANRLLPSEPDRASEPQFPLDLILCRVCGLLQIERPLPPAVIFDDHYPYFSSVSPSFVAHARTHAEALVRERGLDNGSLVIEIASNDGYLLRHVRDQGVPVLGIEPAPKQARQARELGIETVQAFFTPELAAELHAAGRRADVIIGNNVLAHVPQVNAFLRGVATLLAPGAIAVFEVPWVADLVDLCAFDTIYHEHVYYFTLSALKVLFERNGLFLEDVNRIPVHGGSLRIRAGATPVRSPAVEAMIADERRRKLTEPGGYEAFADGVSRVRRELPALLRSLRSGGARIAAYGAAAKGATLLNVCGVGPELIDFVVDRSTYKQGRLMPGVRIPIVPVEALHRHGPDYLLLLAWNFEAEIRSQLGDYLARGHRMIVPVPVPVIRP